jgi:hypothetical protein
MLKLLAALKYHAMIMAVVQFVEHTLPDDAPGTRKLDAALKALIKMDAGVAKLVPEVTTLIAGAKEVYNQAKAEVAQ